VADHPKYYGEGTGSPVFKVEHSGCPALSFLAASTARGTPCGRVFEFLVSRLQGPCLKNCYSSNGREGKEKKSPGMELAHGLGPGVSTSGRGGDVAGAHSREGLDDGSVLWKLRDSMWQGRIGFFP